MKSKTKIKIKLHVLTLSAISLLSLFILSANSLIEWMKINTKVKIEYVFGTIMFTVFYFCIYVTVEFLFKEEDPDDISGFDDTSSTEQADPYFDPDNRP